MRPKTILKTITTSLLSLILIFTLAGCGVSGNSKGRTGGIAQGVVSEGVNYRCFAGSSSAAMGEYGPDADKEEVKAIGVKLVIHVYKMLGASDSFIVGAISNYMSECGEDCDWRIYEGIEMFDNIGNPFDVTTRTYSSDNDFWIEYVDRACRKGSPSEMGFGIMAWTDNVSGSYINHPGSATHLCEFGKEVGSCWQSDLMLQGAMMLEFVHQKVGLDGIKTFSETKPDTEWAKYYGEKIEVCGKAGARASASQCAKARQLFEQYEPDVDTKSVDFSEIPFPEGDDHHHVEMYAFLGGMGGNNKCAGKAGGCSSIAEAMVTMSYDEDNPSARGHEQIIGPSNDAAPGAPYPMTQKYIDVHDDPEVKTDSFYASCDRGARTAIVWSKADVDFPNGNTDWQRDYMNDHPDIWEPIDGGARMTLEEWENSGNLEPGDVLCLGDSDVAGSSYKCGHIVIYVGEDIVKEQFELSSTDKTFASASYKTRGPKIHTGSNNDDRKYWAWRCKTDISNAELN